MTASTPTRPYNDPFEHLESSLGHTTTQAIADVAVAAVAERLEELQNTVTGLQREWREYRQDLPANATRADRLDLGDLGTALVEVAQTLIDALRQERATPGSIDPATVGQIDRQVTDYSQDLADIRTTLEEHSRTLAEHTSQLAAQDGRLDTIEGRLARHGEQIEAMQQQPRGRGVDPLVVALAGLGGFVLTAIVYIIGVAVTRYEFHPSRMVGWGAVVAAIAAFIAVIVQWFIAKRRHRRNADAAHHQYARDDRNQQSDRSEQNRGAQVHA